MASTILQNLPAGGARTARSAGRQSISPETKSATEKSGAGSGFDQALKKSVDSTATPREDESASAAQKPSSESARPKKAQRGREREADAPVDDAAPVETPTDTKPVEQKKDPLATDEATETDLSKPAGEQAVAKVEIEAIAAADPSLILAGATAVEPEEIETIATADDGEPDDATKIQSVLNAVRGQPARLNDSGGIRGGQANVESVGVTDAEAEPAGDDASTDFTPVDAAEVATSSRVNVKEEKVDDGTEAVVRLETGSVSARADAIGSATPQAVGHVDASHLAGAQASPTSVAQKLDLIATPAPVATPLSPERFADANHPTIVSTVRGQLLPTGGTMQIRLDPPELGALLVQVSVRDGVIDASFQTSNADATQLLSHSLTQLKHSLESQGVSVDKLQVSQAPRSEHADKQNDPKNSHQQGQSGFDWERHSNQQRKEMLKRMWAKLGAGDPLDLVA